MSSGTTATSYPQEYAQPPVYHRVPSIEAIERMQRARMTAAEALKTELPADVRATL